MSSSSDEEKIYDIISKALLSLCEEKPNDPVNSIITVDKIALQNLKKYFYNNYKIIEEIPVNNYLVEDIKLGETNGQKCVSINKTIDSSG